MPPSKAEKKKSEKIIEDRTFGLKNKNKSKVVQKFVKGVEQTVKHYGMSAERMEADEFQRRKQKKKEEEEEALLKALYNDAASMRKQAEEEEEDPKNIVCPYFKQGLCQKGKKCIYSHDLTMDRTEEIDLYVDQRTQLIMNAIGGKQLGSLSQDQLGKMIGQKEQEMIKGCRSNIVCQYFLDAVEKDKYGWNWSCPNNGDKCKYKHCLPPGYKLKRDGGSGKVEEDQVDIEEKIDEERNKLLSQNRSSPLVTFEVFLKWKEQRRIRKEIQFEKKRKQEEKKGKHKGGLRTGRQLFQYDPTLFIDDEEAAAEYEQEQIVQEPQLQQDENGQENSEGSGSEGENDEQKVEQKVEQEQTEQDPGPQQQQTKEHHHKGGN